jgi:hypothetical protein
LQLRIGREYSNEDKQSDRSSTRRAVFRSKQ